MHIRDSESLVASVDGDTTAAIMSNGMLANSSSQSNIGLLKQATSEASISLELNSQQEDPFDGDTAPIMYMSDNRTSAVTDIDLVVIFIIFVTSLLLTLVLLPSIRRNKWRNLICLWLVIIVGASVPISMIKNTWMVGERELFNVPYDSLYRNQFSGLIKVEIGLKSMNVTLVGTVRASEYPGSAVKLNEKQQEEREHPKLVHYNERFHFDKADEMQIEHQEALKRGLPYPILSVSEFFSQDSDGFNWTRQIRHAGYYTNLLLYVTFASWLITIIIMCVLPAYFMTMLRATCLLSIAAHLNFLISAFILSPSTIVIYSNKLSITPNYTVILSTICSLISYYCALYIDAMFELQDVDQSLTIMDSDEYLKDKRALEQSKKPTSVLSDVGYKLDNKSGYRDSVIIPIGDIEEKFGLGGSKLK